MIQTLQTRLRLPHLNYLLLEFLLSLPSSQSDKSIQFKLRSEPWFCVSSGSSRDKTQNVERARQVLSHRDLSIFSFKNAFFK